MLSRIIVPMVSVRKEAFSASEQVSQLLFGDFFSIVERQVGWLKIQNERDYCVGFIDASPESFFELKDLSVPGLANLQICIKNQSYVKVGKLRFAVTFGSSKINQAGFTYINSDWDKPSFDSESALTLIKKELIGSPYLWGGKTYFGIDCSGLTQLYGFLLGKSWPRDSRQQAERSTLQLDLENAKRGDLLFYKNDRGTIVHVGLNLGKFEILHASVRVKIEKINQEGIINSFTQQMTHKFAGYISVMKM